LLQWNTIRDLHNTHAVLKGVISNDFKWPSAT